MIFPVFGPPDGEDLEREVNSSLDVIAGVTLGLSLASLFVMQGMNRAVRRVDLVALPPEATGFPMLDVTPRQDDGPTIDLDAIDVTPVLIEDKS